MEEVLSTVAGHGKRLEAMASKHQQHATRLKALKTAFEGSSQDCESLSTAISSGSQALAVLPKAFSRLQSLQSALSRLQEDNQVRVQASALRVEIERSTVESEAEARRQALATEYLSALKALK